MLVGYNNNVTYKGKVYHVQTEDSGLNNPIIVTLRISKAQSLLQKKTSYSHLIGIKKTSKKRQRADEGTAQGNTQRIDCREVSS